RFGYMAPEQLRGERSDRRCDIYSAGVLLWELVTGPTRGAARRSPTVSRAISDVCLRALQPDPAGRYATAADFAQALREAAARSDITPASPYHVAAVVRRFKNIGI